MQNSVISKLKKAKTAHIRWRTYAEALVSGHDQVIDQLPVKHTDCEFGHWYYGDGQEFSQLEVFKDIGLIHQILHEEFEIIFNLVTGGDEKVEKIGFFAKLLGRRIKNSDAEKAKAIEHLIHLKVISMKLIGKIEELERYMLDDMAI